MTLSRSHTEWAQAHFDTPVAAICVKTIPNGFAQAREFKNHQLCGRLKSPPLVQGGDVYNDARLAAAVREYSASDTKEIVVVAHDHDDDKFVWKGTGTEFLSNWIGD